MLNKYTYLREAMDRVKREELDLSLLSQNTNRAFQNSPMMSTEEDQSTRLIGEYTISVCLLSEKDIPLSPDYTIYGKMVGYPPPSGVQTFEIKSRVFEATAPIPKKDYEDLICNKNALAPKTIKGDPYTKVVYMKRSGNIYIPINNMGFPVKTRAYSSTKGWYKC